ncbi:hypothetical protein Y032_0172g385 [Ancylostoma ceylanicum]|uniref:Uncharacterized protein n=2 Tax=Ancylostoma ceylanicum TaxID=53326 RepID=A0A016SUM0_9BILA|nr:hypothetical protein Y032_0172g385 [Ancylostoma ceylanicum]
MFSFIPRTEGVGGDPGSSSDEYRRRRLHEMHERHYEERAAEYEESQRLQKFVAVVLAIIIIVMAVMFLMYSQVKDEGRRITQPYVGNLEVLRYKFGVMSENLDCSVHMKRRYTLGDTPHDVIRQGLMCLYALAPHTVHEESSVQLIFAHRQTQLGMVESIEKLRLSAICNTSMDTTHCRLSEIWTLMSGFHYSRGKLRDSRLSSVWFEPKNVDEQRHAAIWSRSLWKTVKLGSGTGTVRERKFRIPRLLVKLAKITPNSEKLLSHWHKRFPYIDIKKMSTKDTITITQKEADLAASIFGSNRADKTTLGNVLRYYELAKDEDRQYRLDIIFPKAGGDGSEALSFMTAFIIKGTSIDQLNTVHCSSAALDSGVGLD